MPTKVIKFNVLNIEKQFEAAAKKQIEAGVKVLKDTGTAKIIALFEDTRMKAEYKPAFDDRNTQRATPQIKASLEVRDKLYAKQVPEVRFWYQIAGAKGEYKIRVRWTLIVLDDKGRPNNLWYWQDQGTNTWTQVNTSPFLGKGKGRMLAGQTRAGIEGKKWSDEIGLLMSLYMENNAQRLTKIDGWTTDWKFEMPKLVHHEISNKVGS